MAEARKTNEGATRSIGMGDEVADELRQRPGARRAGGNSTCGPDCPCHARRRDARAGEPRAGRRPEMGPIYLDHAATTPVRPEVLEAMLPYFAGTFGNASSVHMFGQKARKAMEDARAAVAHALGANPREIHFTSGGTESDNLAVQGVARANRGKGRHLIASSIEHHAVLSCCKYLEEEGYEVTYLPVDRFGIVDPGALARAIRPDTILVSVMLANNETGTLQPLAEMAEITRDRGVPLHTDAVQAVGRVPVDVQDLGVDLLSVSGHKMYGPKGIGALYVRMGTRIHPLFHGGHHERQRRPGTENVASIVGLAKAMEIARTEMHAPSARLVELRDRLERGILAGIPRVHLNGHPDKRLPNILNVGFESVEGESLLHDLDALRIAASTGSACTSGSLEPSHVLQAMGVRPALAGGSLRFSLGRDTTEEEIDYVIEALRGVVRRLRQMSSLYPGRREGPVRARLDDGERTRV